MTSLVEADRSLFRLINRQWSNAFFDSIMPWLRNGSTWAPLYLFLLVFVASNFKKRSGWWIVFFICTVALTDMAGTYLFKHNFQRLRPCFDPELAGSIRLLINNCSGGYSFTSNHAANHFGMATFFFFSFRHVLPKIAWIGFLWAAAIAYAQVYVGVHYPFDVLGGAILGTLVGSISALVFNKRFGFAIFDYNQ